MTGNQKRTSANTSINGVKLPAAFTKVKPRGVVFDYGCGKFFKHIQKYVHSLDEINYYLPYDKYNQNPESNFKAFRFARQCGGANMVYCCNVLNVIDDAVTVQQVVRELFDIVHDGGEIVIQIYEGDKSHIGRETKPDCWQRNEHTKAYGRFLNGVTQYNFNTEYKGNIIHITNIERI